MRSKHHPYIGLRVCKTALAVTLSLWVAQLIGAYSPIFAGLGAIIAMARTLREALRDFKTQVVGLLIGAVVSLVLLLLDDAPSVWLTGAGVLAAMVLCGVFRAYYAMSLATVIVLSVCISTGDDAILALAFRLVDTSVGLGIGLAVNLFIRPYNNCRRVTDLLYQVTDCVPPCLDARLLRDLYPDLSRCEQLLRSLDTELELYASQFAHRREAHRRNVAHFQAMGQLAARIHQNLEVIAAMDAVGAPSPENLLRLRDLGLDVTAAEARAPAETVDVVTNYHLDKVLDAYQYLLDLLNLPPEPEETPPEEPI